ncbi:MAG: hypothetical protein E7572_04010 [Ruminococcaceae bacterium]|jgi:hypothetical protein|nr:hypothetical protein [Oscillospiraceae bacterium]
MRRTKARKKWLISIAIIILIVAGFSFANHQSLSDLSISNSSVTYSDSEITQRIKTDRDKWLQLVSIDLPDLAHSRDKEKMSDKLSQAIAWCDNESDYFLSAASQSDSLKQACRDIKTGLYGAESSCFEPMLKVFKDGSPSVVDNYSQYIDTATDYVSRAYDSIN